VVAYLLPLAVDLYEGKVKVRRGEVSRWIGAVLILLCLVALGGVAGVIAGGDQRAQIVAGVGAPALFKAALTRPSSGPAAAADAGGAA
jgi:hypothetical protein